MLIYTAHCYQGKPENMERAKKIVHDLQVADTENCYISPLIAFSHLAYNEVGYQEELELCLDILSCCDKLLITSEISDGVRREIEFARMVGMEVEYL